MRKVKLSLKGLTEQNKQEIMQDKQEIEKIEKKIEQKYENMIYTKQSEGDQRLL